MGDIRAARRGDSKPATAAMRSTAPKPPAQARRARRTAALDIGVDGGAEHTQARSERVSDDGGQDRIDQELDRKPPLCCPEGASQLDLTSSFEHRNDHDAGYPDRTDEKSHPTKAQEQVVEGAVGIGLGDQGGGGRGHVDFVRVLETGRSRENRVDCGYLACLGTEVGRRRVPAALQKRRSWPLRFSITRESPMLGHSGRKPRPHEYKALSCERRPSRIALIVLAILRGIERDAPMNPYRGHCSLSAIDPMEESMPRTNW